MQSPHIRSLSQGGPSLERLFARFVSRGDVEALGAVFDRTSRELLVIAAHLTRDAEDAEDLLQETFLAAIENAGRYDRTRPLMPWLVGILSHQARHHARRRGRRITADRLRPKPTVPTPRESSEESELVGALGEALDRVPESYREVLHRHLAGGERPREIAAALGRAPGTVRVQLHRGLDLLRKALPPGLALGAAVQSLPTRGLAAVRAAVLGAAAEAPVAGSSAGASLLTALAGPRPALLTALAALVLCGGWLTWSRLLGPLGAQPAGGSAALVPAEQERLEARGNPRTLVAPEDRGPRPPERISAAGDRTESTGAETEVGRVPRGLALTAEEQSWLVRGRVTAGQPFEATSTVVTAHLGHQVAARAAVDEGGHFELDLSGVSGHGGPGLVAILADHPDFARTQTWINAGVFRGRGGERMAVVNLHLEPPVCILTGMVVPAPGPVRVGLFPVLSKADRQVGPTADDTDLRDGRYRLRVPSPGFWMVVATSERRPPADATVGIAHGSPAALEVDALELASGRRIEGEVRLPGDYPSGCCVVEARPYSLLDARPDRARGVVFLPNVGRSVLPIAWQGLEWNGETFVRPLHQVSVDGRGKYVLEGLSSERYSLQVRGVPGLGPQHDPGRTIAGPQETFVDLVPQVAQQRFLVTGPSGPVPRARVSLYLLADGELRDARTDERGLAELLLPPRAALRLEVGAEGFAFDRREFDSPPAGARSLKVVRLKPDAGRSGTLLLKPSSPLEAGSFDVLEVEWRSAVQKSPSYASLELESGTFRLEPLRPGTTTVRAWTADGRSFGTFDVEISEGEVAARTLRPEPGGFLRLQFVDRPRGVPLRCWVSGEGGRTPFVSFVPPGRSRIGVVPRRTAELPGGGVLESFQPLPQGIYRVQVEEVQGSRSWTGEVRISSAKGATAKVELCSPSFIDEREIRRLMYTLKRLERQRAKRTEKQLERLGYGEGGPDEEH